MKIEFYLGEKLIEDKVKNRANPTTPNKMREKQKFEGSLARIFDQTEEDSETKKIVTSNDKLTFIKTNRRMIKDQDTTTIITYDVMSRFSSLSPQISRQNSVINRSVMESSQLDNDSFLETYNSQNSIFRSFDTVSNKKYSMTSVNSVTLESTNFALTKNSSMISQFDEEKGEIKEYFYFMRPCGDEDKDISFSLEKKKLHDEQDLLKNSELSKMIEAQMIEGDIKKQKKKNFIIGRKVKIDQDYELNSFDEGLDSYKGSQVVSDKINPQNSARTQFSSYRLRTDPGLNNLTISNPVDTITGLTTNKSTRNPSILKLKKNHSKTKKLIDILFCRKCWGKKKKKKSVAYQEHTETQENN